MKIWSRNGLLRTTLLSGGPPVYSAAWSPDSNKVLLTQAKALVIKPLSPNNKQTKWQAHDGLVLKVAWCSCNDLIISGGEDCKYKVWDTDGRQLYSSLTHDHPITSLAWAPGGELFAVGSFNTLRLCDKAGWSQSLEKPDTGSIYDLVWSSDGTQVAGACANGSLLLGSIVQRKLEWQNFEAIQTGRKSLLIRDVLSDSKEKVELPERIILMSLSHAYLILTAPTQCYVYSTSNFNTPCILDLRDTNTSMILQAEKYFLLVEKSSVSVYTYDGRLITSPRWPNMLCDHITRATISMSSDCVLIRDQIDEKVTHLFEISSSSSSNGIVPLSHSHEISQVAVNQYGGVQDRHVAFIDKNRDLYLAHVFTRGTHRRCHKLGIMVQSICWNTDLNILAAMQDAALCVWFYPAVVFADQGLLRKTVLLKDIAEFGKTPSIVSYVKNHLTIRRYDGSIINYPISPYISILHTYAATQSWSEALSLCRTLNDETLWACLAGMATHSRDLATSEEAYAAIEQVDKVLYINYIKNIPVKAAQQAEMYLLGGNLIEAETLLLQHGLIFRAIQVSIVAHNWDRALELALRHKSHIDTVLYQRKKYLDALEKIETNEKFLRLQSEIELDEEKMAAELKLNS